MRRLLLRPRPRHPRGALLLEVLVAILLCTFGLLGFAALQARASSAELEALQRSQALLLVQDMVSRISANRARAGDYVRAGLVGGDALQNCAGLDVAATDVCEWGNMLRGASETRAGVNVGAMFGARGCISRAAGTSANYQVSVVWLGLVPTGAPPAPCGAGDASFPEPALRRAASATVCVALLRDPAPLAAGAPPPPANC